MAVERRWRPTHPSRSRGAAERTRLWRSKRSVLRGWSRRRLSRRSPTATSGSACTASAANCSPCRRGSLGIPVVEVGIPPGCLNEVYEARMAQAFASEPLSSVDAVAFGDLFLEDVRAYRNERLASAHKRGLFPLWGRDTTELAREFIAAGFQAVIACRRPTRTGPRLRRQGVRPEPAGQAACERRPLRRER